jgi:hypothetical protein
VIEVDLSKSTPIAAVFVPAEPKLPVGRPLTNAEVETQKDSPSFLVEIVVVEHKSRPISVAIEPGYAVTEGRDQLSQACE